MSNDTPPNDQRPGEPTNPSHNPTDENPAGDTTETSTRGPHTTAHTDTPEVNQPPPADDATPAGEDTGGQATGSTTTGQRNMTGQANADPQLGPQQPALQPTGRGESPIDAGTAPPAIEQNSGGQPESAGGRGPDEPAGRRAETAASTDDRARQLRAEVEGKPTISLDEYKKRSRRSFLVGAAGVAGGLLGWRWVQTQQTDNGIPQVLRNTLEANETLWSNVSQSRMAPEYPVSKATPIQVTGRIGISDEVEVDAWSLRVEGPEGELLDELDLAAFESMPQNDMVIEHKCIEGWSSIVHWGGVRFRDFHEKYASAVGDASYVGLETPDGDYYVGWDIESILHPQTMLVLRQGTEPLTPEHGAPVRLATPNKYGIKCLKRIGVVRYSHERPADYWAERSYDWYAGL